MLKKCCFAITGINKSNECSLGENKRLVSKTNHKCLNYSIQFTAKKWCM